MATEKPRFTVTVSEETLKRIEDYQFMSRQKNRNEAVISLIEIGLAQYEGLAEGKPQGEYVLMPRKDLATIKEKMGLVVQLMDEELALRGNKIFETAEEAKAVTEEMP